MTRVLRSAASKTPRSSRSSTSAGSESRAARRATTFVGWATVVLLGGAVGLGLSLPPSIEQKHYSKLIAIHPGLAWASYLAVGVSALAGFVYLIRRGPSWDRLNAASLEVGALFTALTLATGSIWGRPVWGVWWQWDPRLTTEALLMALLLGAVALRRAIEEPVARGVVSAAFSILLVPLTAVSYFSVIWWRSLHQGGSLASLDPGTNLDTGYIVSMLLGLAAFSFGYAWLITQRMRLEALEAERDEMSLESALEARRAEAVTV